MISSVVKVISLLIFLAPGSLLAQIPTVINYQGILLDENGRTEDGVYSMAFAIYSDSVSSSDELWFEQIDSVRVRDGFYNVLLGAREDVPFDGDLFKQDLLYFSVRVNEEELLPRSRVSSVLFAFKSENSDRLGGRSPLFYGDNHSLHIDGSDEDIVYVNSSGFVGVGTRNAQSELSVEGTIETTNGVLFADGTRQSTGLVTYDSGWWDVVANDDYPKMHNLGTDAVTASLWYRPNASSDIQYGPMPVSWRDHNPESVIGAAVYSMTDSMVVIRTGDRFYFPAELPGADSFVESTVGQLRLTMIGFTP